ncbi:MAG: ATP-binding protein [Bacteroidetes bacterium]|nr:ATP-binding protein [Fibrella sp.]
MEQLRWSPALLPDSTESELLQFFAGFKLKETIKFKNSTEGKEDYIKSLLRQKSFIDSLKLRFFQSEALYRFFVELRFVSDPSNKSIDIYLLVRFVSRHADDLPRDLLHQFTTFIPEDMSFVPISDSELANLLKLQSDTVIEVRKKTSVMPTSDEVNYVSLLPSYTVEVFSDEKIEYDNFHIVCADYLPYNTYNWSTFFKQIQDTNDVVCLRISLSSASITPEEKLYGIQSHKILNRVYHSNGLQSEYLSNYLFNFSKFFSSDVLFTIKVQLSAGKSENALLLGSAFCTQFSYGRIKTYLEAVPLPNTIFESDFHKVVYEWENCHQFFYEPYYFTIDSGDSDALAYSFITKLPYIFAEEEAASIFKIPIADEEGLPGISAKPAIPFYQPSGKPGPQKRLTLGHIITKRQSDPSRSDAIPYGIPVENLTKHGLIVGSTGSGKTNTTLNFVKELTKHGIPFLLIEPVKSEYYDELIGYFESKSKKLNRFTFSNPFHPDGTINEHFFRFNPLIPMPGVSIMQHISLIKGCFNAAFPMHGIMPLLLEECLYDLYNKTCELDKTPGKRIFNPKYAPSYLYESHPDSMTDLERRIYKFLDLDKLGDVIQSYLTNPTLFPDAKTRVEIGGYLQRRVVKLTQGLLGHILSPSRWNAAGPILVPDNIQTLLTESSVIEMESVTDNDDKALLMAFLLTMIFEYRQNPIRSIKTIKSQLGSDFDIADHIHITLIEEAHRLLSRTGSNSGGGEITTPDSKTKAISLFMDMLAEIRAKGEGIFIVEQIPTKLVSDVIKNTNLKIMHRITSKDDRHYLGEAMNMNEVQQDYVTNLKTGEAILFEEQLDAPVFVKINEYSPLDE